MKVYLGSYGGAMQHNLVTTETYDHTNIDESLYVVDEEYEYNLYLAPDSRIVRSEPVDGSELDPAPISVARVIREDNPEEEFAGVIWGNVKEIHERSLIWYDDETELYWQNPPSEFYMPWNNAYNHCDGLTLGGFDDWRLPNIDELISLIRGCQNGTATGDLNSSTCEMYPTGCAAADNCEAANSCMSCDQLQGPDSDGCYWWHPDLSGVCWSYWSSSSFGSDKAWRVRFKYGNVGFTQKINNSYVRCVRNGS
ncbi:MAG: DUF1566 domain-containing protein [Deltaproteobacteria bacterium]|nr:DUF1566 domain-containing protein [Deltaproteobacteria bacterium]